MTDDNKRDQVKYIHWLYNERFDMFNSIPAISELNMARQQGYLMIYFKKNKENK